MNKEAIIENNNVFYRVIGKGNPVMLIHGFGEDGNVWKEQVNFLKNKFQLIVPDLPGSGQSAMNNGLWSMNRFAEIIKKILDCEKTEYCTLIGHSMGGYITLAFAEKYPERLDAFGLFHSTAFADSDEKKESRKKGIEFIRRHGAFEFLKTTTPNLFSPASREKMGTEIQTFIDSLSSFSADALVTYYQAMMQRPDRTEVLTTFKKPVLFVLGEYDNAVPLKDGLKQCHLPDLSYIHILQQSGHMGMMEEKEKSNRVLEEFLKSLY